MPASQLASGTAPLPEPPHSQTGALGYARAHARRTSPPQTKKKRATEGKAKGARQQHRTTKMKTGKGKTRTNTHTHTHTRGGIRMSSSRWKGAPTHTNPKERDATRQFFQGAVKRGAQRKKGFVEALLHSSASTQKADPSVCRRRTYSGSRRGRCGPSHAHRQAHRQTRSQLDTKQQRQQRTSKTGG